MEKYYLIKTEWVTRCKLKDNELLLFGYLCSETNYGEYPACVTYKEMAKDLGICEHTAVNLVRRLKAKNFIQIIKDRFGNYYLTNPEIANI